MRIFSLILCCFLAANLATAKTIQSSTYNYFIIKGQTAPQIYASLLAHANGPAGHDAYATTLTRIHQKADFLIGKNCTVHRYDNIAEFKINLPKLKSTARVNATALSDWNGFANVLKRHEEHHRSLWLACATKFNSAVQHMNGRTCDQLGNSIKKLWAKTEAMCRQQNNAFDKTEQAHFLTLPFIRLLLTAR
jgi:predicted secreted Zn-dependent protease